MPKEAARISIIDPDTGYTANITEDGKLSVDTELNLSGDVYMEHVTVAQNDAGYERKLRVDTGTDALRVTVTGSSTGAITRVSGDTVLRDGTTIGNRAEINATGAVKVSGDILGTVQIRDSASADQRVKVNSQGFMRVSGDQTTYNSGQDRASVVSVLQRVQVPAALSYSTSIAANTTWSSSWVNATDISTIQIIYKGDRDVTIYIDQGQNGSTADVTDNWDVLADTGWSQAVASVAPYARIRIKNKNVHSALTPNLATGLAPIFNPLPRVLDSNGNFQTAVHRWRGTFGKDVVVSPMGAVKNTTSVRLAGATFASGSQLDSNYWNQTVMSGGATATTSTGTLTLATGAAGGSSAIINSQRVARYTGGQPNYYRANIRCPAPVGGTICRRWGAFDSRDGFFFENSGDVWGVVARKGASDSNKVTYGSFNGDYGPNYSGDTNVHTYEIHWTNKNAYFTVDDVLLHTLTGSTDTLVSQPHLKIGLECTNALNNSSANTLVVRSSTINRLGNLVSQPTVSYFPLGQTAGTIYKYGPGNIHGIVLTSMATTSVVTLYDGIDTTGRIIFGMTYTQGAQANNAPVSVPFYGAPFSTGLFLVVATANSAVTLIYE